MTHPVLGTLTIGQAPRPELIPVIDRHVPAPVRRIHRGVLDGLSRAEIADRYRPEPGEPALVTRLHDGAVIELSRARMRDGIQQTLAALEAAGCDAILVLCTGTFEGLECRRAWLIEPDRLIPPLVAALIGERRLGVIVPIASQIASESGKWRGLATPPLFAAASPYAEDAAALVAAAADLQARGAAAVLLDCIGFTERHRDALAGLALPVLVSTAIAARMAAELLGR